MQYLDHDSERTLFLAKAQPLLGAVDEVFNNSSSQIFRLIDVDGGGEWELAEFMSFFRYIHKAVQKAAGQENRPRAQLEARVGLELRPAQYPSGEGTTYGDGGLTTSEKTKGGALHFPCIEIAVHMALADPKSQGHGIPPLIVTSVEVSVVRTRRELRRIWRRSGNSGSNCGAPLSSAAEGQAIRAIGVRKNGKAAVLQQTRSNCEPPFR